MFSAWRATELSLNDIYEQLPFSTAILPNEFPRCTVVKHQYTVVAELQSVGESSMKTTTAC